VLPAFETFPAFCFALGLYLVPAGFVIAHSRQPAVIAVFTVVSINVMPLLAPTNQMIYNTTQFYNSALAIAAGCVVAPLAFGLLPPLSATLRARRLLSLTLRDLRRLAISSLPQRSEDWESRMYGRLAALPEEAEPLQRARLLAALSIGSEIIQLRHLAARVGAGVELDAALAAFAQGNSAVAIALLQQLDQRIASVDAGRRLPRTSRACILVSPALPHASYSTGGHMRFAEIDLFGVCVAPISLRSGLARHDRAAPPRQPLGLLQRVASGPVHVCRVHHRSLVLDLNRRNLRSS
jgi:uncharacterized membrane protein YccC